MVMMISRKPLRRAQPIDVRPTQVANMERRGYRVISSLVPMRDATAPADVPPTLIHPTAVHAMELRGFVTITELEATADPPATAPASKRRRSRKET